MSGYNFPYRPLKLQVEQLTVICKRCKDTWQEEVAHYGLLAGYARNYDFCDKCVTESDQQQSNGVDDE